jgi:hypothetical protein
MTDENRVSLSYSGRSSGLEVVCPLRHGRSYVQSRDRTSTLTFFKENLIFSSLSAYFPTPKANTDSLSPPNSNRNLYTK